MDTAEVDAINDRYYTQHATGYAKQAFFLQMDRFYEPFLAAIPAGGQILDLGCGPGRDTHAFLELGYRVTAVEPNEDLARIAESHTGQCVLRQRFSTLSVPGPFRGIWASASLLHVRRSELPQVLEHLGRLLAPGGILFASFKQGDFEGLRAGRHFTDHTEQSVAQALERAGNLELRATLRSRAQRAGHEEHWLAFYLVRNQ